MNKFELAVPQENHEAPKKQNKKERINKLRSSIKTQYDEMYKSQDLEITKQNQKKIEDLVFATQDLIDNCIKDKHYSGNRDETFVNLIYVCHKLDLKLETYKLTEKMQELESKSKDLIEKQNNAEERNNNLVYNLLGFLTAFSIVSGVVGVVTEIKGIVQIMIFMTFTILILLTTLIGLHNFYENNNKRETKLQNNYFLWKATLIVLIALVIVLTIKGIHNNKENILNYLDSKIENAIEQKINDKM
jgi:NADH:ubiquinone oxidoreductase subunit 6 (subunit J)